VTDSKTGKQKRKSSITKNELFRQMIGECHGKFMFDYVLADSWFSSVDNMICYKEKLKTDFIMALKSNCKVALSQNDKNNKKYVSIKNITDRTADRGGLVRRIRFSAVAYQASFQERE